MPGPGRQHAMTTAARYLDLQAPVAAAPTIRSGADYARAVTTEREAARDWLGHEENTGWEPPPGLIAKVGTEGRFLPFFGDTVVLPLSAPVATTIDGMVRALHATAGPLFAEPLAPSTCHVTLHDLVAGSDRAEIAVRLAANTDACRHRLDILTTYLQNHPEAALATLVPAAVFMSCRISVVMGLTPADEGSYRHLLNAYRLFDAVAAVPYWPRFHVTLAYLRPVPMHRDALPRLRAALATLPAVPPPITVDLRTLVYQQFSDMNHYTTVIETTVARPQS